MLGGTECVITEDNPMEIQQFYKFLAEIEYTERENEFILTNKVESLTELKFDPEFRVIGEYRIFETN